MNFGGLHEPDALRDGPPPRPGVGVRVLRAVWRSRVPQALAALLGVSVVAVAVYASWLYQQAWSEECSTWEPTETTMDELIELRGRIRTYQGDPTPGAELVLEGDDVNVLLGEGRRFRLRAHFVGQEVSLRLALEQEEGCYDIDYRGTVEVEDGVILLRPGHLSVGSANLDPFARGRRFAVTAEQVPDEELSAVLGNIEGLRIHDGRVHVRFEDRWELW